MKKREAKAKYGIVILLDALGIGTLCINDSIKYLGIAERLYKELNKILDQICRTGPLFSCRLPQAEMYTFGDTILLTWEVDQSKVPLRESLIAVGTAISVFLGTALRQNILFRGAFSFGEYVCGENVVIGPAVAEAARWYEEANQVGIVLTPRAAILWDFVLELEKKRSNDNPLKKIFVDYRVPVKKMGSLNMWTIPWPIAFSMQVVSDESNTQTPRLTLLHNFYALELPVGSEDKLFNTIKYFDHIMERFPFDETAVDVYKRGIKHGIEIKKQGVKNSQKKTKPKGNKSDIDKERRERQRVPNKAFQRGNR